MSQEIRDFKDLLVWKKGMALTKSIYRLTTKFPSEERFALTSQLRRAAVSIPSNIAEGHARHGREFAHFLSIARGSLAEVETQLMIAVELNYVQQTEIEPLLSEATEIRKMSAAIIAKLC